jgi:hypothetical protein
MRQIFDEEFYLPLYLPLCFHPFPACSTIHSGMGPDLSSGRDNLEAITLDINTNMKQKNKSQQGERKTNIHCKKR